MKKRIYITRHGETDYNKAHLVQGRGIDLALNEVGLQQGQAFCTWYKDIPFNKVYTSTLIRSRQTVEPFINAGIPTEQLAGLDELSFGIYEGEPIVSTPGDVLFDIKTEWFKGDYEAKVEGGESLLDVVARQKTAFDCILENKEESLVLVCMHGRALRILLSWMLETELKDMEAYPTPNTALYILDYDYTTCKYTCIEAANIDHAQKASDF